MSNSTAFPNEILKKRIKEFFEMLPENSIAILSSPTPKIRSNDVEFRYRPSSKILYLTGIKDPSLKVVFTKKGKGETSERKITVFRKKLTEEEKVWIGEETPDDEIKKIWDDVEIKDIKNFGESVGKILASAKNVFLPFEDEKEEIFEVFISLKKRARSKIIIPSRFTDISFVLGRMRAKKDEYEIKIIRQAVSITKKAVKEIEKMIAPGVMEYEIDAELLKFYRNFGGWEAFPTIVASGKNSVILHYSKNSEPVGSPCIVDTGAEFNFYSADITRTFIKDGFAKNQKEKEKMKLAEELKKEIENIQKKIISEVKEGTNFEILNNLTRKLISELLLNIGILRGNIDEIMEGKKYKPFFPHSIGHHLGLDVHDECLYYDEDGNPIPLAENAIITIEPGIYFPCKDEVEIKDERDGSVIEVVKVPEIFQGIGIRVEDDILVKKGSAEIL
ncbi:Xaa-Pro aminopeptidase [bacterium HR19]|nr:Xaa-Pro aminopeptidase [bacterium HR19]